MSGVAHRVGIGLAVWALVLVGVRVTFALPERCATPTPVELEAAIDEAVGWFAANLHGDGRWTYAYERDIDTVDPTYNIVRHAGVLLALAHAQRAGVDRAAPVFAGGLSYALDNLVRVDDDALAFALPGARVEAGASALLVAALVEHRRATGSTEHDEQLRSLGRFLVGQIERDGRVLASWSPARRAPVPELTSPFFTGETAFALAALHATFPEQGWDEPTRRVAHYLATARDDREPRFPPVSDHWAAYTYDEIAHWPDGPALTDADRAYAQRLAGLFSVQARWESQKPGLVGALSHGADVSASGVGTWGEGVGALWRAADADPEIAADRAALAERARCVSGVLVDRQVTSSEVGSASRPRLEQGAWFSAGRTQMDGQQHALSALVAAAEILEAGGS